MANSVQHQIAAARHAAHLSQQIGNGSIIAAVATLEHFQTEFLAWATAVAENAEALAATQAKPKDQE